MKKCIIVYGNSNSGKSLFWDLVMGYSWNYDVNNKNSRIRHLPDGLYKKFDKTILLIAQSIEETKRDINKVINAFQSECEFDTLFISVQNIPKVKETTFKFIKEYGFETIQLYTLGDIETTYIPDIEVTMEFETLNGANKSSQKVNDFIEKVQKNIFED